MITRIQLLRNIGQFDSVSTGATIPLASLTLVYSENGRGKTTLAAVLRSLATGDPVPIAERRRLAAQHPPHVIVECSGGPPVAIFQSNAWNRTLPCLAVFDDVFIDENVHSGLAVQSHHRQNLHELILGAQAVALSKRLQELVTRIETHNRELRAKERAIPGDAKEPYSVDDFCALPGRADIDAAIQEAERDLAAAREQDPVRTTPSFQSFNLPRFDLVSIERLLEQDLPALDSATLVRVQAHLASIGQGGEAWVAEGIRHAMQGQGVVDAETCPFCGQALGESALIEHYRAYFSDAYASLKRDVTAAIAAINRIHGSDVHAGFERTLRVTVERRQFWSRFCEVEEIAFDSAALVRDWEAAREEVVAQLSAKQAAPLEPMQLTVETRALVERFEAHRRTIAAVNQRLQETNKAIGVAKERIANANPAALADDLSRLKAIKARHEPTIAELCNEYLRERAAKQSTEQQRDQTRVALEQHRTTVFPGYETAINLYLAKFNAGFRLDSVTYRNTRGGPTCTYNVLINRIPVPVDGSDSVSGEPSFRNTLSAGDRNTLALAFFFASMDQDANLAGKVVVIDDPISSLDEHRTLTTVQEIRRLAGRAGQVIVLSHNKPFLCRLWDGINANQRAALEVVRDGTGSTLRAWDVAQDSITEHDRRHALLHEFLTGSTGNMREVAQSIRPHLEAFLRVACPAEFTPGTLLGPFRHRCQQNLGIPNEILEQTATQELSEIVEYANRFHHDTNPAGETEAINDAELRGFVDRTLRFCRR